MILLVVVQGVVAGLAVAMVAGRSERVSGWLGIERELRGSMPPSGRQMPDLSALRLSPRAPAARDLRGEPALVVVTCIDCRSGEVAGRAVAAVAAGDVPGDAALVVVGWGGTAADFRRQWQLPARVRVHVARDTRGAARVRDAFHVGASGVAFLYDAEGRWRATYHLGQMFPVDMEHDLRVLD